MLSPDGLHGTRAGFAALPGATRLTCADSDRPGQLGVAFAGAKGLLMRLGSRPSGVQIPEPPPLARDFALTARSP